MRSHRRGSSTFLLCLHLMFQTLVAADGPLAAKWSDQRFGPDGPWPALEITAGGSGDPLAVYPGGGISQTFLITKAYCANYNSSRCYAQNAGIYNPGVPTSGEGPPSDGPRYFTWGYHLDSDVPWRVSSDEIEVVPGRNLSNQSIALVDHGQIRYPGGQDVPLFAGCLGLGDPSSGSNYMANGLHNNYSTPSSSWGLHLGSTTTGPAPSLYFGGYDKTRAYGDVLSKPGGVGPVDLLDIKIGVLAGLSPYEFNMTSSGLLHKGSIQQDPVSVGIDPCAPYLSIPRLACDAIAEYLPVTLDRGLGLYIWDVASPQYTKIVNSATALSFVFSSSDFYNVTISVPFKHLNLTLTSPLTETEVSYFPCNPLSEPPYVLGRAFLQDAFISQNYERDNGDGTFGRFYMAQAAGPNISGTPTVLPISKPDLGIVVNGNSDWMATWDGYWTPLSAEQASNHNNGTTSGKPQVLPSGAIAGIAVGVVVIVLLVIGLLTLFILKKQNKTLRFFGITVLRAMPTAEDRSKIDILHEGSMDRFIEGPPNQISEMEHKPPELFAGQVYHELPLTNKP